MALPPVPPKVPAKSGFHEAITIAQPRTEIVKRRPTKLEPWMIPTVKKAMNRGCTLETAADFLGISERTLRRWIAEGEAEGCNDELLLEFCHVLKTERAEVVGELIDSVRVAALTDGKIGLELLKVLAPSFNIAKKVDNTVEVKAPPKRDLSHMTLEEKRQYRELEMKALKKSA